MRQKMKIYKAGVLAPIIMICSVLVSPFAVCIPAIDLYWEAPISRLIVVVFTVFWLCCSPLRKTCCDSSLSEFLFYLVPVETVLMMVFAQRHFILASLIVLILIACETSLYVALHKDEHKHKITKKKHRLYKAAFQKSSVLVIAIICVVPCFLSLFVYGLRSPTYQSDQEADKQLLSPAEETLNTTNAYEDLFQNNTELWSLLGEEQWKKSSIEERIIIMQRLVDFEANRFGMPTIKLTAGMIGIFTLGAYDNESNEMWINTEHLTTASVDQCIQTICHESHHAFVDFLVENLPWDNPALNSSYFNEIRTWAQNQKNYKNVWEDGEDEYLNQPLEVSARTYAIGETALIMGYVEEISESE